MSTRNPITILAALVLMLGVTSVAAAKSLYVIAHHDGTYSAYNINPGGSVTWQADYASGAWGPAGIAVHDASATLFVTYEFSGNIVIVDATTMGGLGSVAAPGASDLAGIDVDDINDIVYAVDRWTDLLYAYSWDASTSTLTLQSGYPVSLSNCDDAGYYMSGAMGIALDEIAGVLYVSCVNYDINTGLFSGSVHGYDVATWNEVMTFTPAIPPVGIAIDRLRGFLYTTAPAGGCANAPSSYTLLSKCDLATLTETTTDMDHGGMGLAVDEVTGYLYATGGCDGDDLSVWDTSTVPFTMMQSTGDIGSPAGLAMGNVSFNPLNLTKDDGLGEDGCAIPGWNIEYEICYDNTGNPFDVTGATLTDNLPAEVAYVSSTGGGVYDGEAHTVDWDLGDIPAGSPAICVYLTVALDATVPPESLFTNFVTIESDQTPPTTVEEETQVCPMIPVPFDIKPMSCRNPLRVGGRGVIPAAILGTPDFDVTQIDPGSIALEGVPLLRWYWEDVETPYEPYLGKIEAFDCHAVGPDGYLDLTVKFDKGAIVAAIGDVGDGQVLVLTVTGNLLPEYGGMPILGEDVVVIISK